MTSTSPRLTENMAVPCAPSRGRLVMYLQEVLFKPSWMLASERDVCLMGAFFFLTFSPIFFAYMIPQYIDKPP